MRKKAKQKVHDDLSVGVLNVKIVSEKIKKRKMAFLRIASSRTFSHTNSSKQEF